MGIHMTRERVFNDFRESVLSAALDTRTHNNKFCAEYSLRSIEFEKALLSIPGYIAHRRLVFRRHIDRLSKPVEIVSPK